MPEQDRRRDGEGFFASWSRRKRAATKEEAAERAPQAHAVEAEAEEETALDQTAEFAPEISAEELAALPSIDEITGQTDLQPFLQRGVPEALRKAAMRKVWLSNALIAGHDDPAVDYAWDWNAPEGVPGAGGMLESNRVSKMVEDLINHDCHEDTEGSVAEAGPVDHSESSQDRQVTALKDPVHDEDKSHVVASAEPDTTEPPMDPVRRNESAKSRESSELAASDREALQGSSAPLARDGVVPARRHGSAIPE